MKEGAPKFSRPPEASEEAAQVEQPMSEEERIEARKRLEELVNKLENA